MLLMMPEQCDQSQLSLESCQNWVASLVEESPFPGRLDVVCLKLEAGGVGNGPEGGGAGRIGKLKASFSLPRLGGIAGL